MPELPVGQVCRRCARLCRQAHDNDDLGHSASIARGMPDVRLNRRRMPPAFLLQAAMGCGQRLGATIQRQSISAPLLLQRALCGRNAVAGNATATRST